MKIKTEVFLGEAKPKKIFQYAEKKGHKSVTIVGSDEVKNGSFEFKRMKDQEKALITMKQFEELKVFLEL